MPVARANGLDLFYEERGEGEPLVLVSGIGMQIVAWPSGFLDRLAARGLRVIVFDNRDVGLSTKLEAAGIPPLKKMLLRTVLRRPVSAPYTLFDMAADVVGLLDALELPKAHVLGVSLGGMVAQAMAIAHGDRMKSVSSLMSQSGGRVFTGRPHVMLKLLSPPPRSRAQAIARQLDFFRAAGSKGFFRDDDALAERVGRAYDRCAYPPGYARQFAAVLATGELRPRLRDVRVPALVVHGTTDAIFDVACGRATADAIPGASFEVIEGWGHDLAEGVWDHLVDVVAAHVLAKGA